MVWTKGRQLAALSDTETTMSFKYDCNGIRTKKTVNGVETKFTYVGSTLVSQKTGDEVINFAYTAGGAPYGFTYNGQSYFYLLNLQGDVIGIYDGNGNVVVEYTYDSWGKLISITGSLASTIGIKNPLRYRGYYYDTETSLYYLQSRYFDPETCRFINADSLLVAGDYLQGTNLFAYCLNNPVMYSDPSGLSYDPVFDTFSSAQEAASATVAALILACGLSGYIAEYALSLGFSEKEIVKSFGDFLGRTERMYDNIFDLVYILKLGVSVMTGSAWWTEIYSDSSFISELIQVMKMSFQIDMGIKGAASFATSVFVDMIPEYLNPLNSNIDVISALGKHVFIETGGLAITASGFAVASALFTAVNPAVGVAAGMIWILVGNEAWENATSSM